MESTINQYALDWLIARCREQFTEELWHHVANLLAEGKTVILRTTEHSVFVGEVAPKQ